MHVLLDKGMNNYKFYIVPNILFSELDQEKR